MQPFWFESVNMIVKPVIYTKEVMMMPEAKKLYRSRNNRMIAGVCAGLADFFGIDTTVVRLVFVAGALLGFGSFILIYIVMFIVVPEEPI
jgi:phage shock protein PspC (stress-responsive transcriptional regulator)